MRQSMFKELWNKMFYSGSRLYLFIGINVIVFLVLGLLQLESLFSSDRQAPISTWLFSHLTLPGALESALYKPWTAFTYMFVHQNILHFIFNMLVLYWFGQIFEDFLNG